MKTHTIRISTTPNKPKNNGAVGVDAPLRSDRKLPNLSVTVTQVQPVVTKTGYYIRPFTNERNQYIYGIYYYG